jgi:hypothetical protein
LRPKASAKMLTCRSNVATVSEIQIRDTAVVGVHHCIDQCMHASCLIRFLPRESFRKCPVPGAHLLAAECPGTIHSTHRFRFISKAVSWLLTSDPIRNTHNRTGYSSKPVARHVQFCNSLVTAQYVPQKEADLELCPSNSVTHVQRSETRVGTRRAHFRKIGQSGESPIVTPDSFQIFIVMEHSLESSH